MSKPAQDAVLAQPPVNSESKETRQDPATPPSPVRKPVFVDAAQPPPLKSAWSSIVKQQGKGKDKDGSGTPAPLQPTKQSAPVSPSKETVSAGAHSQHLPAYAQLKVNALPNGRQVSPRAADKDSAMPLTANGHASPHSGGASPSSPFMNGQSPKGSQAEKQTATAAAVPAQPQAKKDPPRDASLPLKPAWKKPAAAEVKSVSPLSGTQSGVAWPTLGGSQEAQRKRRGSSAPTTPSSSQNLKPSPPSSEAAAVIPLSNVGEGLAPTSQPTFVGEGSSQSISTSQNVAPASIASAPDRSVPPVNGNNGRLRPGRSSSGGPVASTGPNAAQGRRRGSDSSTAVPAKSGARGKNTGISGSASVHGPATGNFSQAKAAAHSKLNTSGSPSGAAVPAQPQEPAPAASSTEGASTSGSNVGKSSDSQPPQVKAGARGDPSLPSHRSADSFPQSGGKQRSYSQQQQQQQRQYEYPGVQSRASFPGMQRGSVASTNAPQMFYPPSMYYPASAFALPVGNPYMAPLAQEQLLSTVATQIEYYFSVENLCKDLFLRGKMDDDGWIPLVVIASFNRVRMLTPDVTVILQALSGSRSIEISPDSLKLRPAGNYQTWVLPKAQRDPTAHLTAPAAPYAAPRGGAQLRTGQSRGVRRRDEGEGVPPRRSSGEGAGSRAEGSAVRAAQSAPTSPSGKLGISTNSFRPGPSSATGKAASEVSTSHPREILDEGLSQHSEGTGASSLAEHSSSGELQQNQQPQCSVTDAVVDRLLLVLPGPSGGSHLDSLAVNEAILALESKLKEAGQDTEPGEGTALGQVAASQPVGPRYYAGSLLNDQGEDSVSAATNAVGWLISPHLVPRPAEPPAEESHASTSGHDNLTWDNLSPHGDCARLLEKEGFRLVKYHQFRDSCCRTNGKDSAKAMQLLMSFWSSFLHFNMNDAMYKDFEAHAAQELERQHLLGAKYLFAFYRQTLKERFSSRLYQDFERVALQFANQHQWRDGFEELVAFVNNGGLAQAAGIQISPEVKQAIASGSQEQQQQQANGIRKDVGSKGHPSPLEDNKESQPTADPSASLSAEAPSFFPPTQAQTHSVPESTGSSTPNGTTPSQSPGEKHAGSSAESLQEKGEPSAAVSASNSHFKEDSQAGEDSRPSIAETESAGPVLDNGKELKAGAQGENAVQQVMSGKHDSATSLAI